MKRRTARAPMKSVIGKNDRKLFTAEDRARFEHVQRRPADLPAGWITRFEARSVMERLTNTYSRTEVMVVQGAQQQVRDRYPHLWRQSDGACDPMILVRVLVATLTYIDHVPPAMTTVEEAMQRAAADRERVQARVSDVLGQVDLYLMDPTPGDYSIETVEGDEDTGIIDLPDLVGEVRNLITEIRARGVVNIDEFFRDALDEGGRNYAYTFVRALRAAGDLPRLRVEKGTTVVLDRVEFERFARQRFACSNLGCFAEDEVSLTWNDVRHEVEDGRVAVHVRFEESLVTRAMRPIAFYRRPSEIPELEHALEHRDADGGFEEVRA